MWLQIPWSTKTCQMEARYDLMDGMDTTTYNYAQLCNDLQLCSHGYACIQPRMSLQWPWNVLIWICMYTTTHKFVMTLECAYMDMHVYNHASVCNDLGMCSHGYACIQPRISLQWPWNVLTWICMCITTYQFVMTLDCAYMNMHIYKYISICNDLGLRLHG